MPLTKITTHSLNQKGVEYSNLHPNVISAFLHTSGGTITGSLSTVGNFSTSGQIISAGVEISSLFGSGGDVTQAYVHTNFLPITGGELVGPLSTNNIAISGDIDIVTVNLNGPVVLTTSDASLGIRINGQLYLIPLLLPVGNSLTFNNQVILYTNQQLTYTP